MIPSKELTYLFQGILKCFSPTDAAPSCESVSMADFVKPTNSVMGKIPLRKWCSEGCLFPDPPCPVFPSSSLEQECHVRRKATFLLLSQPVQRSTGLELTCVRMLIVVSVMELYILANVDFHMPLKENICRTKKGENDTKSNYVNKPALTLGCLYTLLLLMYTFYCMRKQCVHADGHNIFLNSSVAESCFTNSVSNIRRFSIFP